MPFDLYLEQRKTGQKQYGELNMKQRTTSISRQYDDAI